MKIDERKLILMMKRILTLFQIRQVHKGEDSEAKDTVDDSHHRDMLGVLLARLIKEIKVG